MSFCRFLISALGCGFDSFQAEVVAFDASGADCSRGCERGIGRLFFEATESSGGVEFYWVAVFALKVGEGRLALFGGVEGGDDGPSRERGGRFDLVGDFGGIRRHHQIPAD